MLKNKWVQFIIVGLVCFFCGYLFIPTKTVIQTKETVKYYKAKQVIYKPDGTVIASGVDSGSTSNEYSKTEINKRSMDFLISYGRDLDLNTNSVGGIFIFEPYSKILVGGGYSRGLTTKSNTVSVVAGFRI